VITELQASGATSLRAIASALNDRGISTARGGKWFAASVRDVLARIWEGVRWRSQMYLQLRTVSDVIMLEAIPETADVVAPPDARHQPRFTARWWRLSMPGPPTSEEGN
jgi:hypothetical protein